MITVILGCTELGRALKDARRNSCCFFFFFFSLVLLHLIKEMNKKGGTIITPMVRIM